MRAETIRENVEEAARLLATLGFTRIESRALAYLAARQTEALSVDVERGADLRQPDVSHAMRELAKRGLVLTRPVPRESRGRPALAYRLAAPIAGTLDAIERERREAHERELATLARLRATIGARVSALAARAR